MESFARRGQFVGLSVDGAQKAGELRPVNLVQRNIDSLVDEFTRTTERSRNKEADGRNKWM